MQSTGSSSQPLWREHSLPDGKKYWFNPGTGQTVWEQPEELSTTSSVFTGGSTYIGVTPTSQPGSAPQTSRKSINYDIVSSWRELAAANGRKYYYNAVTKAVMWEMPPEYAEYLERIRDPSTIDKDVLEQRFLSMLKEKGITSKHTWEECLRDCFQHPNYKIIPTLAERKALFAKYVEVQREVEKEEQRQQRLRDRQQFKQMLRDHYSSGRLKLGMRYSEVLDLIKGEAIFAAVDDPRDRADLYDEFVDEQRRVEQEEARNRRRLATEKTRSVLDRLVAEQVLTLESSWRQIQPLLVQDADLKDVDTLDLLDEYESFMKQLERRIEDERYAKRDTRRRDERLNRKAFRRLLSDLEAEGRLTAVTSWSEIFPLLKTKPEFTNMLTQSGSSPLDLFWDHLNKLQEDYLVSVSPLLKSLQSELGDAWLGQVTEEIIRQHASKLSLKANIISAAIKHFLRRRPQDLTAKFTEEQRDHVDQYRKTNRRQVDRLKSLIKSFSNPRIELTTSFEEIIPALAKERDFQEVDDDLVRRYYFEKYIKHLKRKAGLEHSGGEDD